MYIYNIHIYIYTYCNVTHSSATKPRFTSPHPLQASSRFHPSLHPRNSSPANTCQHPSCQRGVTGCLDGPFTGVGI